MEYNIGDTITYYTLGGIRRTVKVQYRDEDIKNGRPGFDGVVIDGPDAGMCVWGYDADIVSVHS